MSLRGISATSLPSRVCRSGRALLSWLARFERLAERYKRQAELLERPEVYGRMRALYR